MSTTVALLVIQSSVQDARTQTADQLVPPMGDAPTYDGPEGKVRGCGEIIVKIEESASPADLKELNRENGARTEEDLPHSDVNLVDLPRDVTVKEAVEAYEESPDVEYAQPNYLLYPTKTANDTHYSRHLYGLDNTGQTINRSAGTPDADIDAPEAWDLGHHHRLVGNGCRRNKHRPRHRPPGSQRQHLEEPRRNPRQRYRRR